jgi:C1A family cysteine protease
MFALIAFATSYLAQPHEEKGFISWMRLHNKAYTGAEYHLRFGLYLSAIRRCSDFNRGTHSFRVAPGKFACLTPAEYRSMLGHRRSSRYTQSSYPVPPRSASPDSWDWRDQNAVNRVQDQDVCGAAYAFAICVSQEGQWARTQNTLLKLSEQNIVDCADGCYGCYGGDEQPAIEYVISKQGGYFNLASDYPYIANDQDCQFDSTKGVAPAKSWFRPTTTADELALKDAIYNSGPASIAVDAASFWFQNYISGVYDQEDCSDFQLSHSMGLVGYGNEDGADYWLVKNQWGTEWGDNGYIKMSRNKGNQCGIATDVIITSA